MASLKDVQFSMNGEPQDKKSSLNRKVAGVVDYKDGKKMPEKNIYVFKLVDNAKKGGVYIPNIDDVWNPETQQVERARLLSGVQSIWMKDQEKLTADYVKMNGRSIAFPRGHKMIQVAAHDKTMLQFLRLCNSNIGNPHRVKLSNKFEFYEYDPAIADKENLSRELFEIEQVNVARQEKFENMKKHAAFLGIRLRDDDGFEKTEEGLRADYMIYAKRNPQYFKDTLGTKQVETSWLIKKGIQDSKIEVGREPGKVYWANGGGFICAVPQSMNVEQYLLELALTPNEDGIKFKEQLQRLVN